MSCEPKASEHVANRTRVCEQEFGGPQWTCIAAEEGRGRTSYEREATEDF